MKYMLIMRATEEALAEAASMPMEEMLEAMGRYNEQLIDAGVMAGGEGLAPAEEGFVVDFATQPPTVTDGAYGPTESLFNGFWILEVASAREAREWAKLCPLRPGSKLEVRRIHGIEDFPADNEWVQKEKEWIERAAEA